MNTTKKLEEVEAVLDNDIQRYNEWQEKYSGTCWDRIPRIRDPKREAKYKAKKVFLDQISREKRIALSSLSTDEVVTILSEPEIKKRWDKI